MNSDSKETTVTISLNEYISLKEDSAWLAALEDAGVDNWSGFDFAKELYNGVEEG